MKLSHVDSKGRAKMVDISRKPVQWRQAHAEGRLTVNRGTVEIIRKEALPKGSPFEVARLAGIQAAKQVGQLIPLCHGIHLDLVDVDVELREDHFQIEARATCHRATGVEMEALTAVSVTALTLYDMCKAVDQNMAIEGIRLVSKKKGAA